MKKKHWADCLEIKINTEEGDLSQDELLNLIIIVFITWEYIQIFMKDCKVLC